MEFFAGRVALQFDLVRIMDQPVKNAVGQGRVADLLMPALDRDLAGEDRRVQLVAIFANLQEVASLRFRQGGVGPIVDHQQVDLGQASQKAAQAAVSAGQNQIAEQFGCPSKE